MSSSRSSLSEIFATFLRLGLTSFGGPIAHLGYYRSEFVTRRKWLDDETYADLVALSQFLPGPVSSQTGFAVGVMRGGLAGGLVAFIGFTLPSALVMLAVALGSAWFASDTGMAVVHGLKLVAVAVVAQAVWGMARSLCPDGMRAGIAFAAMALVLSVSFPLVQLLAIGLAALAGWLMCRAGEPAAAAPSALPAPVSKRAAIVSLLLFVLLLVGLPQLDGATGNGLLRVAHIFYGAGALVFGGGHVVLPLLEASTVAPGYVSADGFLAGYGAAQAVPGPLFTFAAYLGALMPQAANPVAGAAVALAAIFLPGFLLVYGALPFWHSLRGSLHARAVLKGVNAGVVGLLAAALYNPIWTATIFSPLDFTIAAGAFLLLTVGKQGPGRVVLATLAATLALFYAGVG